MDSILFSSIRREIKRQQLTLDLIASENVAPPEVLAILGSPLVNKYSEGYPGKRYYPGNKFYDEIEELARARALAAFHLKAAEWAVNVQPYSGSPANQAIYFALAKPGDSIMGLSLSNGGHLTHGHRVNFSGIMYRGVQYGVHPEDGTIDYESLAAAAKKYRPRIIVSGATAYPRKIDFKRIGEIARKVRAYHVADISHIAGLIVAGVHPDPFSYADVVMTTTHKTLRGSRGAVIFSKKSKSKDKKLKLLISDLIDRAVFPGLQGGPHNNVTAAIAWTFNEVNTPRFKKYAGQVIANAKTLAGELLRFDFELLTGGTDNHLIVVNLRPQKISGTEAEKQLENSGIIANRNTIPGDEKPFNPSGIRLGTPSLTSRGMKEKEMKRIAEFFVRVLLKTKNVRREVESLCQKFPLPYKRI